MNIILRFSKYSLKSVLLIIHSGIIIVYPSYINIILTFYLSVTPDPSKTCKDDYKKAIVDIIAKSVHPITVKNVLNKFQIKHGFTFPFQVFSCGTCMDFFRLYPDMFKVTNLSI